MYLERHFPSFYRDAISCTEMLFRCIDIFVISKCCFVISENVFPFNETTLCFPELTYR